MNITKQFLAKLVSRNQDMHCFAFVALGMCDFDIFREIGLFAQFLCLTSYSLTSQNKIHDNCFQFFFPHEHFRASSLYCGIFAHFIDFYTHFNMYSVCDASHTYYLDATETERVLFHV